MTIQRVKDVYEGKYYTIEVEGGEFQLDDRMLVQSCWERMLGKLSYWWLPLDPTYPLDKLFAFTGLRSAMDKA